MEQLDKWVKVVVHPLGLIGFSLLIAYYVFLKSANNQYIPLIVLFLAFVSIVGGIFLGYKKSFLNNKGENNNFNIENNQNTEIKKNEFVSSTSIKNNENSKINENKFG